MRIAFITPEFVTDYRGGGGLGTYLHRISGCLARHGHEVEIFVASRLEPPVLVHEGVRVERVPPWPAGLFMRIVWRVLRWLRPNSDWEDLFLQYSQAVQLAEAMERRHRERSFDLVQSADYRAVGIAVKKDRSRLHVVRCSTAIDLYNSLDGRSGRLAKWQEKLERASIRGADTAYAPSNFVAAYYKETHGMRVQVVRPPFGLETAPAEEVPCSLPDRFFVHFGQLNLRKGTIWLGEALARALVAEPGIRMVWIGRGKFEDVERALSKLECGRTRIQVHYPMDKKQLYAVLRRAEASVLPSLADNLPNTVIESLMLGIPVIGTRGASVDELVEQDITGELVNPGDVEALAAALVKVWRGESRARKGFRWDSGIAREMQPEIAVQRMLELVKKSPSC